MTKNDKIHLTIVSLINLTLILSMICISRGNDRAIILVIYGYPTIIIINLLVCLTLRIIKRPEFKIYKITAIGLIILFIPTFIASILY